jgi:hypothetical protein
MPEVLNIHPTLGYSIGGLSLIVNFAWVGLVSQDSTSCGCFFGDIWAAVRSCIQQCLNETQDPAFKSQKKRVHRYHT